MLEVQPPGELILADGEGVRIGVGLDLVAQGGSEPLERLERLSGRAAQVVLQIRRFRAEYRRELHHQLAAAAQHGERRIDEHRRWIIQRLSRGVEERGDRPEPLERRGRPAAGRAVLPAQDRVEALEEMVDPEDRVALVRPLVLEPVDGAPELAEQRRPVDLVLQVVHLELFDRAGDRPERRHVLAHRRRIEPAEASVLRDEAGRAGGGRVEVVLEVQVGPAELIDGRHRAPWRRAYAGRSAATSEWSPSDAVPVSPSATT